jgi:predicted CXXCH cytochrome family protein
MTGSANPSTLRLARTVERFIVSLLAMTAFGVVAQADEFRGPNPPRGQGEHCVADPDFMRRNHMDMMIDHRREAVHDGVREKKFSLAGCVSCHAVKGADGQPVAYADQKHFCRSCHAYAAVRIDCFECHKSTPDAPQKFFGRNADDAEKLAAHLREVKP